MPTAVLTANFKIVLTLTLKSFKRIASTINAPTAISRNCRISDIRTSVLLTVCPKNGGLCAFPFVQAQTDEGVPLLQTGGAVGNDGIARPLDHGDEQAARKREFAHRFARPLVACPRYSSYIPNSCLFSNSGAAVTSRSPAPTTVSPVGNDGLVPAQQQDDEKFARHDAIFEFFARPTGGFSPRRP